MDTRVVKKKLGLKERYAAMTRGLHWDTTYQPMDKVFPIPSHHGRILEISGREREKTLRCD